MATELFTHPTHEQLRAFAQGRLSSAEMSELEQHIAHCDLCCLHLERVPDDTLVQLAREAATQGVKSPAVTRAMPVPKASPGEIPKELRDHPRYRVLSLVGHGGMGAVYKAEHRMMERLVALKVINPALLANPQAVERFNREFRAAGKLSHPNIVAAYDADQAGDLHFFVMEFVDGVSLDRVVAHNGPLPPKAAADLINQAAEGLQHAHEKGMVHRDIKPQNLMMTRQKKVKILDFGLIRLGADQAAEVLEGDQPSDKPGQTTAGMVLGTPDYIAPEQATDARTADGRADIYSLGCTLYYLLTGKPPFPSGSTIEKIHLHLKSAPPPIQSVRSDVPAELARILDKMLAKDPAKRYQTPGEVAKELAPLAKGQGGASQASGRREPPGGSDSREVAIAAPDALIPMADDPLFGSSPLDNPALALAASPLRSVVQPKPANPLPFGLTPAAVVAIAAGALVLLALLAWGISSAFSGGGKSDQIAQDPTSPGQGEFAPTPSAVNTNNQPPAAPSSVSTGSPPITTIAAHPESKGAANRRLLLVVPNRGLWYPDYSRVKEELATRRIEVVTVSTSRNVCELLPESPPGECIPDRVLDGTLSATDYDGIIFAGADTRDFSPSGPLASETRRLMKGFKDQGKVVAAICAGQRVLAQHGALHNKRVAKCNYVDGTFGDTSTVRWNADAPASTDGNIITARGDRDAAQFADEIAAFLNR